MLTEVTDCVYVGDRRDAEQLGGVDGDPYVVTLAEPEIDTTTSYHPLTDGANDQEDFNDAVDAVRERLGSNRPVVVHCRMGRSRSPTVLATALAAERDELFDEAIGRVHDTGRFINPHPKLAAHARDYLDEDDPYASRADG